MKDFLIYGAGRLGRYTLSVISLENKSDFLGFIDNGYQQDDTNIFLENDFDWSSFRGDVLVAIINEYERSEVIFSLVRRGINNIYIISPEIMSFNSQLEYKQGEWNSRYIRIYTDAKPFIHYFETHLSDKCNLNCRACAHYSNIHRGEILKISLDRYESDLEKMSSFFEVQRIGLLGGEPLMNQKIGDYITITRASFPDSIIEVVTNGLLIPSIEDSLFELLKKNNVRFKISLYPPTIKILDKIETILAKNNIPYILSDRIERFSAVMSNGTSDPNDAYMACKLNKGCLFLRDGNLSICPMIPLLFENQTYFKFKISREEYESSVICLYKQENGWQIGKRLTEAANLCRFCSPITSEKEWSNGVPEVNDWFA